MNFNQSKNYFPPKKVFIVDTTLRDGNQSAYGTMYDWEKIEIAKQLERMGVDVIEAGFAVSNGNSKIMEEISRIVKKPCLSGLARAKEEDIDATYKSLSAYENRGVHIFVPTSDVQVKAKFNKNQDDLIRMAVSAVKYARKYFRRVEFTAEDTVRSDFDFLQKIYSEAVYAGATVINIADTVGCADPEFFGPLVREISRVIKKINPEVCISVHCHNDLGLAFANTLAGIRNGADAIECTINGLGERAGNCSIEQVVARTFVEPRFYITDIDAKKLYKASQIVSEFTGIKNDTAPVVGKTAFAHKSGIHQHALTNNPQSYEALNPAVFGRQSEIIIGPHSGHHGMIEKARQLGFAIDESRAKKAILSVSERVRNQVQKRFEDSDLIRIIREVC
jgi:2-isopropylmalate synthase